MWICGGFKLIHIWARRQLLDPPPLREGYGFIFNPCLWRIEPGGQTCTCYDRCMHLHGFLQTFLLLLLLWKRPQEPASECVFMVGLIRGVDCILLKSACAAETNSAAFSFRAVLLFHIDFPTLRLLREHKASLLSHRQQLDFANVCSAWLIKHCGGRRTLPLFVYRPAWNFKHGLER